LWGTNAFFDTQSKEKFGCDWLFLKPLTASRSWCAGLTTFRPLPGKSLAYATIDLNEVWGWTGGINKLLAPVSGICRLERRYCQPTRHWLIIVISNQMKYFHRIQHISMR